MAQPDNSTTTIGIVLLAAGNSTRLGHPKQLVSINGVSLLQHSLSVALLANTGPVVLVLGAHAEEISSNINSSGVQLLHNAEWQEGMAASIRCGIDHLQQTVPQVDAAILMVCDQPYVSAKLLHKLVAAYKGAGKPIVTCSYAETFGPPTLFHKTLFPELQQLKGDVGGRRILNKHADLVVTIPFPEGVVDIDTNEDYLKIKPE